MDRTNLPDAQLPLLRAARLSAGMPGHRQHRKRFIDLAGR